MRRTRFRGWTIDETGVYRKGSWLMVATRGGRWKLIEDDGPYGRWWIANSRSEADAIQRSIVARERAGQ